MKKERCCSCDEETDRAGIHDDSLYPENGKGPFCEACYENGDMRVSQEDCSEAQNEHDKEWEKEWELDRE